ncbi:TAT-variant-translocated molybdopterin oxidoreductase [Hymenobacter sp. GOD-10R]|uniref:TAT-variant-translocated molybdopterin oxidoreductase n=1 Tax=Hymenobacter sp. GOD-10R TaxID=3093922 RepID=UPI002D78465A|nr:TAT-variant-translocated molybdopterin oxidoreductase [Hymenobacter sp. GOD-10R]WRQ29824.1 TAT-variant-translocated molybdopterin oxidoreductase [Hymenobacter sp. GOD-10R]
MQESPKYWKGIEELENSPEFVKNALTEFADFLPVKETYGSSDASVAPRRDFLKLMGFGIAAATLASCQTPIKKAIPYLNKPEEVDPGIANFYASSYFNGTDYNSILVKTREGRPIKLEGNPGSPVTRGGLSARAQASVLSLYDGGRLQHFTIKGQKAETARVDQEIRSKLASATGRIAIVSPTIISPTTKKVIAEFAARYPNTEHVMYDANSSSALLRANGGVLPAYDFSKADVIVSLGADFLGTWLSPVEYARQYITNRKVSSDKRTMSRHFQFEPTMSLTGANADVRVAVKPSEMGAVAAALYNGIVGGGSSSFKNEQLNKAVAELQAHRGRSLVVSSSNDVAVQTLVVAINQTLGNVGTTVDTANPSYVRQGDDARLLRLVNDMNAGTVGAVIFYHANPAYNHPLADKVRSGIAKVPVSISLNDRLDETGSLCYYACPDHNFLESWNDYEPKRGFLSLAQPAISPLFATRQAQDSLLTWAGNRQSYYNYLRANWRGVLGANFQSNWDKAVHDGIAVGSLTPAIQPQLGGSMTADQALSTIAGAQKPSGIELALYEKVGVGPGYGADANNPWLQELPDPVSKATWGNYLAVPRTMAIADENKWEQGDIVRITTANGQSVELPILIQPGQAQGTVSVAIGYGREKAGRVGDKLGANVYPLVAVVNNSLGYATTVTKIEKTGAKSQIAQTQTHHTIMDRKPVVQEATLAEYIKNPKEVTEYDKVATPEGLEAPRKVSLWQDYEYKNHHWGMVIDLNSCIGCGSCVLGCQIENNVAVVGKQEVINRREMHWLRIDRYYSSDHHKDEFESKGKLATYRAMEDPSDNPSVIFQPMLCQHCNHAPCETVCPVLATTHSSEGLNQMTYNRCVGTRYCANNCPYKVRRFNWFSYYSNEKFETVNGHMFTDLGRMVLNPDVTVRARGVMEKCSFCVQRIQLAKLEAKKQKRRPKDGEVVTACAQSCPTQAIVFGDLLDPESQVHKITRREHGERGFYVLDSINTQSNITYLTKIRNTEESRNA